MSNQTKLKSNGNSVEKLNIEPVVVVKYNVDTVSIISMIDAVVKVTGTVTGNLYVFPVPTSVEASGGSIYVVYQSPTSDFDGATDEPDVPQEFFLALKFCLASYLSFEVGYPTGDRRDLFKIAEDVKKQAFDYNQEEESFSFQIDRRGY